MFTWGDGSVGVPAERRGVVTGSATFILLMALAGFVAGWAVRHAESPSPQPSPALVSGQRVTSSGDK